MNILPLILAAIILVLDIIATRVLISSPYYDKKQKLIQLGLVWLVPVMGGILVWTMASEPASGRVTTDLTDHSGYDVGLLTHDNAPSPSDGGGDGGGD
jgi:hypothetical protein